MYKAAGRVWKAGWSDITVFVLTDDYRIKLLRSTGRCINIPLSVFGRPNEIVDEIRSYLGSPEIRRSGFAVLSWGVLAVLAMAQCCLFLQVFSFRPAFPGMIVGLALGCAIGLLGAAYLWRKKHRPIEEGVNKYLLRAVLDMSGILVGVAVILSLCGLPSSHAELLFLAVLVGRLLASGVFTFLTRRRDARLLA